MRTLIHIGYPKTATKWLQRRFFDAAASGLETVVSAAEVDQMLVFPNGLDFDADACRRQVEPKVAEIIARGVVPVVSDERLSGLPHAGGCNSKEMSERLGRVFPTARILLVIREHRSMLYSIHQQYIRAGGQCALPDYLQPPVRGIGKVPLFDFGHYRYDRLIRRYIEQFGAESVLVLPFELFCREPVRFLGRICEFAGGRSDAESLGRLPLGVRENDGWSPVTLGLTRLANLTVLRGTLNPWVAWPLPWRRVSWERLATGASRWIPARLERSLEATKRSQIAAIVKDRYRQSNRATADLIGFDLGSFGYDL